MIKMVHSGFPSVPSGLTMFSTSMSNKQSSIRFSPVGGVWWAVIIYSNGRKLHDLELAKYSRLDNQRALGI